MRGAQGGGIAMIRTATMMIGGLLLLLVACPLHALAKISPAPPARRPRA